MKQRIITGSLIAAVVLITFIAGGLLRQTVISAFILVGLYETYAIKEKEWPRWLFLVLIGSVLGLTFLISNELILASLLGLIMFLYFISILNPWFTPLDLGYLITMILLFTGTLKAILMVFDQFGIAMMIYLLIVTYMTDTGAYFFGFYFGKTKLNERISPKKTIEGSIGGGLAGFIGAMIFGLIMIKDFDLITLIGLSAALSVIGQIGDLAFSDIKRHFKIKDFGSVFPAHGGVLDRIDSLVFNLLFFYLFISFFF